jgi:RHS repeat-associated protein
MLEETHFYPFGLTMAGISDKALKTPYAQNKYRYNEGTELQNKEFADGTGLEMYDAGYRTLDPQLGRFSQIDPLPDQFHSLTPYQYAGNNPVFYNDPTGLDNNSPSSRSKSLECHSPYGCGISADPMSCSNCGFSSPNDDFLDGSGAGGGGGGSGAGPTGGFGDDWAQQALDLLNDPDAPYGGQLYSTSFGTVNYTQFSSSLDAFAMGADALYLSGFWGTGQAAVDGFNAAQQAYEAVTGVNPELNTILAPVVAVGYYSGNTWVTINSNELMDQLRANGAEGEEESGLDVAGKVIDGIGFGAETASTFKLGAKYLGESAEFISKGAAFVGAGITVIDMFHQYHPHQVADLTADVVLYTIAEASGPLGWVAGGLWFLGNLAYEHYHGGRSITQDYFDPH